MQSEWTRLERTARTEVERTLEALPDPLRAQARRLPVVLERYPSPELEADGIEPDTLGLFVGEPLATEDAGYGAVPSQIILYLDNLYDEAAGEESVYRLEVRKTYLHELGHFLGLDEADLDQRGLL